MDEAERSGHASFSFLFVDGSRLGMAAPGPPTAVGVALAVLGDDGVCVFPSSCRESIGVV